MTSCWSSKNIITYGTFGFSLISSLTILSISSYKILTNDENSELWTGMLTFLVGLYIPSPVSSFIKMSTTGNSVVQQNIHTSNPEEV